MSVNIVVVNNRVFVGRKIIIFLVKKVGLYIIFFYIRKETSQLPYKNTRTLFFNNISGQSGKLG